MVATIQLVTLSTLTLMHSPAMDYMVWLPSCPVLAVGLGIEPSLPIKVVQISNLLHYHPAPRPLAPDVGIEPTTN